MEEKRLDKKQSENLTTLVKLLFDAQFVFVHHVNDMTNADFCPCHPAAFNQDRLEVFDLASDDRFNRSAFLRENPHVTYYFGQSLYTDSGERLGTLCIYKCELPPLSADQKTAFHNIALLVSELIDASFSKKLYFNELSKRNRKLIQLFEQSRDALMTLEPPNWCFSSGNPAALSMFNVISEEEFTKLGPWAVSPEFQPDGSRSEDKARLVVMKALSQGSHTFEWVHKSVDGKEFPCCIFLNRITEGNRQYLQATVRDISEEKQLEDGLKNQLAINQGILNSTNEGILLVDHTSRKIQSYNSRFLEIWKIPQTLVDTNDDNEFVAHVMEQLTSPEMFVETVEKLYDTPDQESLDTLVFLDDRIVDRYSTPYICDGDIKGRIWFFRDVTDIRAMERMLNQTSRLAAIGQLAAGIGHEINNPLTIVNGYLSKILSRGDELPADILEDLKTLNCASTRIENIVTGLRSFANIEKNTTLDTFNLSALLFEIDNMLKGIYNTDGVHLVFNYEQLSENVSIVGDRGKFEQVLINLISNAKDSTEGMSFREVRVEARHDLGKVLVSVIDNGIGIEESIRDKIFDPFFTTKDVGKGTGIGLSLVYRYITDEFHGEIDVKQSGLDNGSQFDVMIPISPESHPHCEGPDKAEPKEVDSLSSGKLKVILAEDEEFIREILTELLQMAEVDVYPCENGALALEEYIKNATSYDLVISDMNMPVMDGLTLLKEIRARTDLQQPKFFFTTGGIDIDFEHSDNELTNTIDGYFYKPFNITDIYDRLESTFPDTFVRKTT